MQPTEQKQQYQHVTHLENQTNIGEEEPRNKSLEHFPNRNLKSQDASTKEMEKLTLPPKTPPPHLLPPKLLNRHAHRPQHPCQIRIHDRQIRLHKSGFPFLRHRLLLGRNPLPLPDPSYRKYVIDTAAERLDCLLEAGDLLVPGGDVDLGCEGDFLVLVGVQGAGEEVGGGNVAIGYEDFGSVEQKGGNM